MNGLPSPNPQRLPFGERGRFLLGFGLLVATLILYWPATGYRFIDFDDGDYVYNNPWVSQGISLQSIKWAFTKAWACNWHPLTWISHMLDCWLYGLFPGGHHLTNILLHSLNALLLFLLLTRLSKSVWASATVAALFAWHPLHVESVAWVAERKDVLSMVFFLLTIWAYVRYTERPGFLRYGLALVVFALGLMAKPMLVTLPFVLLLLDYWPLDRMVSKSGSACPQKVWSRLLVEKLPFLALSVADSVVTILVQGNGGAIKSQAQVPYPMRVLVALEAYAEYVLKTVWPSHLSVFYPLPAELPVIPGLLSALALGGATWACYRARQRFPWLLVGWLWFLGTLVPVIGVIQVGTQAMADRYTYIPMIGLLIMAVWSLRWYVQSFPRVQPAVVASLGVILCACAIATHIQLAYWQDSIRLFTHALSVTRNNAVVQNSLGRAFSDAGQKAEAIEHFEEALNLMPSSVQAHYNLAIEMAEAGNLDQAQKHFSEALKLDPRSEQLHNNLGVILAQKGNEAQAINQFKAAMKCNPDYPKPYLNYGIALQKAGLNSAALTNYATALELDPNYWEAMDKLALLLATCPDPHLRNPLVALKLAARERELTHGDFPVCLDTLATAYAAAGDYSNAVVTAEATLRLAKMKGLRGLEMKAEADLSCYRAGRIPKADATYSSDANMQR